MSNELLFSLYEQNAGRMTDVASRCGAKMEGPFLTSPSERYWESGAKVAFVGQETRGWSSSLDIKEQMLEYSSFNLGEKYYSSPFWNVIRKIETITTGSHYSSAWLNLNRYDQEGRAPSSKNKKHLEELDFLLTAELNILKPDFVFFLTGPNYDQRIENLLNGQIVSTDGFDRRQFGGIESPLLKSKIFRTYHPNYLRRSGLERSVIEKIKLSID